MTIDEKNELPIVRVDIHGNFTAHDLERVIATLAQTRAALLPEVPMEPPKDLELAAFQQDDTLFRIRSLIRGGLRVWLRHAGAGWLAFTLTPEDVVALREFLGRDFKLSERAH